MAKAPDDLEAVRSVTTALEGFDPDEQERILRWAREKLGLTPVTRSLPEVSAPQPGLPIVVPRSVEPNDSTQVPAIPKDLKTFVNGKNPRSDSHFVATVAYFYRFEAPPGQRRDEIDATILQDACRLASRPRFTRPSVTLNNTKNQGLLDRGAEGKYAINTVGENLVAMTLPGQSDSALKVRNRKRPGKTAKNRTATKKK